MQQDQKTSEKISKTSEKQGGEERGGWYEIQMFYIKNGEGVTGIWTVADLASGDKKIVEVING